MRPNSKNEYQDLHDQTCTHVIKVTDIVKPLDIDLSRPLEIEVGCGKGRFLTSRAAANPDCDFLGIERMFDRVRIFDGKCARLGVTNARVLRLEALYTFHYLLPAHHARRVYVFFPDPWPKKKHHSHRLFGPLFRNALWKRLELGGRLEFATDHAEYFEEVCAGFAEDSRFRRVEPMPRPKEVWTEFETMFREQGLPIHSAAWEALEADDPPLEPLKVPVECEPREGVSRRLSAAVAPRVHFLGIGGVGMAALAALRKLRGDLVSGCDLAPTPRTRWLESLGIPVATGHHPAHVREADLVIATPAVRRDNPELVAAKERGVLRYRGEMLAELVNEAADSIVVCGSHGKTTTATYVARLLLALGENVRWAIGGETGGFPVAGSVQKGPAAKRPSVLVVEGDESDGSLEQYHARTLVVTNVEYDHPDHFKTPADYLACFDRARANAGCVIEGAAENADTAIAVAKRRGHSDAAIRAVLGDIVSALPDRRFQRLEEGFYADYAHHPTEIRYTIARARRICRGKLRVLFQPHRYSRTLALKADFAAALSLADEVTVCPTYSAFESPVEGGDSADLYCELRKLGRVGRVFLARSCEEAWTHARRVHDKGDLALVLGAGDIVNRLNPIAPAKIWIGVGSNTWRSDLDLGVEYVRTSGPAGRPGASLNLPFMAGVPGTVGGWVKMNAGAFGHSVSELVEAVNVDGRWLDAAECGFGYRTSSIRGEIRDVRWKPFRVADYEAGDAYLARRAKFPSGTYGSVFKNPEGDFAGRLLETAGAKSLAVGGASVWERHANVIVRGADATASDVLALAQLMRNAVRFRFGLILDYEVCGLT